MIEEPEGGRLQIVEERLYVEKRVVETDRMRIRTVVDEHAVQLDASVARGVLAVERSAHNREVASAPPPREEGDLLIVSVIEERVELVKRLFLVEELHIRRSSITEAVSLPTTVRSMRAIVERGDDAPATTEI